MSDKETISAEGVKVLEKPTTDSLCMITITQLPKIEEQLGQLKVVIDQRTSEAMELECTEDNKKDVKNIRSELNKEKNLVIERYKAILDEVVAPIREVEAKFKDCIEGYKKADENLKQKIAAIEDAQKEAKSAAVEAYFNEYAQSKGIDFINFRDLDIKINLSTSETSLKKQVATFLERVATDLKMISTQDDEEEILVEYKKTLRASEAITTVKERKKRIQAEKERKAKEAEAKERAQKAQEAVINAAKEQEAQEQAKPSAEVPFPEVEPGYIPPKETAQPLSAPVAEKPKRKFTAKFAVSVMASSTEEAKEKFGKFKPELMALIERSGLAYEH